MKNCIRTQRISNEIIGLVYTEVTTDIQWKEFVWCILRSQRISNERICAVPTAVTADIYWKEWFWFILSTSQISNGKKEFLLY